MKRSRTKKNKKRGEFWRRHIATWQRSGLSQAEYCRRNALPIKSFGYWKRKSDESSSGELKFFPLVVSPPLRSEVSSSVLLTLQGKRFAIKIDEDFSPSLLKKLILSLEEL